ncbi:NADPH oxidase [Heterobasidion irregulare TC 32-1]|uniref:NADPH oxidase n=1 Tax=Heterobasidion irregulare (strain TC 32-1) TaxID=747525 RepID=W4JXM5_HETIT|nr:NADPH oxidase [Heterobasidion irregulare TC 32-1]ETW78229.1 NADPH oxidase [Heterobasidion irregulare TC 32-1]
MPGVSLLLFESHPFTIANADVPRMDTAGAVAEGPPEKGSAKSEDARGKELVFVVRARQGLTKRLMDVAQKGGPVKVFVDGPYGVPPSLKGFDTVVFIAGGSGVTFTSPLLLDLVRRARQDPSACRRVIFLWSIRHADHINLAYADLAHALAHAPASLSIDARIHITSPEDGASEASSIASPEAAVAADEENEERGSVEDEKSLAKIARLPRTTVARGRPDVEGAIEEACALARGSVSVNVCGPASLSRRVRGALCAPVKGPVSVLRGGPSVELHVEQFGIA